MVRRASIKTFGYRVSVSAGLAFFAAVMFMAASASSVTAAESISDRASTIVVDEKEMASDSISERGSTIVVKEKGVVSGTRVGGESGPAIQKTKPFEGRREKLPAGAAVVGAELDEQNRPVPDVVSYASTVVTRDVNSLVLNTTISKVEDDETLSRLAGKVYMENNGQAYENVTIFWHVGTMPRTAQPWGRTDIAKGTTEYKVIRLQ